MRQPVVQPRPIHIGRTPESRRLYAAEEFAADAIIEAARKGAEFRKEDKAEFWTRSLPQALFDMLDHFDPEAVRAACRAMLEQLAKDDEQEGGGV